MSLLRRWPYIKQDLYDRFICSEQKVAAERPRPASDTRRVTVAIPHYNRGALIHQTLHNVLKDGRVSEIIIVDDGSKPEHYEELRQCVSSLDRAGKVQIHRREENRGALWTKMECVEKSTNSWVVLLDADNTLFRSYLDGIFAMTAWEADTIYCPSRAFPHFDFRELAGRTIDFEAACDLSRTGLLRRVYIINDGNYFLNRASYLETLATLRDIRHDVADVMVVNYLWLSQGKKLHMMPGAVYCHRLSASSFWSRTASSSRDRVLALFARFDKGLRWDDEVAAALQSRY